jgi:hypothetical protein
MWKTISSRDDVQEIVAQIRKHRPHTLITGHASKLSVWILCVRAMELVRCAYTGGRMSALGHKQTLQGEFVMSALPPKADIDGRSPDVRFVPILLQKSVASFFGR